MRRSDAARNPRGGDHARHGDLLAEIREQKAISDELTKKLKSGLDAYEQSFLAENKAAAPEPA